MSSGYFDHRGGLPIPQQPPRPDIDPTLRVSPAPRPGAEAAPHHSEPPVETPMHETFDEGIEEPVEEYDAGATMEAPLDYDDAEGPDAEDVMFEDPLDADIDATAHEMPLPEE